MFWLIVRFIVFFAALLAFLPGAYLIDAGYVKLGAAMVIITLLTWVVFGAALFIQRRRDRQNQDEIVEARTVSASVDPIQVFNQGVSSFSEGEFKKAGMTFSRLLENDIDDQLRMVSAYACHLCEEKTGTDFSIPNDLAERSDQVGASYATHTAAGLFLDEGRIVAIHDGQLDVLMGSDSFELVFASMLAVLSVEIFYVSNRGKRMYVDGEAMEEVPTGKYAFVLRIATEAGSGSHPPVEMPDGGFPLSLP